MPEILLPLLVLLAQAPEAHPGSQVEFEVAGMTCPVCAREATKAFRSIAAVRDAEVDFDSRRAVLRTKGAVPRAAIRKALQPLGLEARFPGDPVVVPLTEEEKAGLDIRTISRGEAVTVEDHLAEGKVTIFDYFADWCGPCHLLSPKLERLVAADAGLALRKIDVSDWESEAARQATRDFRLPGLPYVRIFGADGRHLADVYGNRIDKVEEIIRRSR